ncbi:MAG: hypothetical protein U9O18_00410 [Chloroflexota bacterium]|nr:hypothetical protein [Chloroflexota bacterium]
MRNVTITLDEETARWVRIEAAHQDVSMSAFLRQILQRAQAARESYPAAMHRYQSRPATRLKKGGAYPAREELHERVGLR